MELDRTKGKFEKANEEEGRDLQLHPEKKVGTYAQAYNYYAHTHAKHRPISVEIRRTVKLNPK